MNETSTIAAPEAAWRDLAEPAPRGLGRRSRKAALVVHILAAGTWLGLDVAMGVLVLTALTADDSTRAVALQAIELVAVGPMVVVGALCLLSGIVLGLGTKWGLVRYWWVAVKLLVNVVLLVLVVALLHPGAAEVAETGRELATGTADAGTGPGDMVFPPIVSTLALSFAITVSVLKPWGRLRRALAFLTRRQGIRPVATHRQQRMAPGRASISWPVPDARRLSRVGQDDLRSRVVGRGRRG